MFDRLCHRIVSWIVYWICHHIAIGGHCGLCGKWVPNELLPAWWRVTICDDCAKCVRQKKRQGRWNLSRFDCRQFSETLTRHWRRTMNKRSGDWWPCCYSADTQEANK